MDSKFTYYDIVAHIVPGTLVLGLIALVPRIYGFSLPWSAPALTTLAAGIPLAYAAGQVIQGLASMAQPIYYKLWGGMPSSVILAGKSKRVSKERLERLTKPLSAYFELDPDNVEDQHLMFDDARVLCNKEILGRVDSFNASYAFHRALLTTGVLTSTVLGVSALVAWRESGTTVSHYVTPIAYLFVISLVLTAVEYVRARSRGEYYALEVLEMAALWTRENQGGAVQ